MNSGRLETARIIADLARERQLAQLQEITALEAKAANLVGFAGIVLALLFTSDAAADGWNAFLSIGAAILDALEWIGTDTGEDLQARADKLQEQIAARKAAAAQLPSS